MPEPVHCDEKMELARLIPRFQAMPALPADTRPAKYCRRAGLRINIPLKLRPTGLGSGIDKDRPDYTVFTGEWEIGRIYQTRGGPDNLRWFWSMTVNGPMTRSDRVATLEEAKAQFQKSWDAWKAWAKMEEVAGGLTIARAQPSLNPIAPRAAQ